MDFFENLFKEDLSGCYQRIYYQRLKCSTYPGEGLWSRLLPPAAHCQPGSCDQGISQTVD
jgi:hypothetical protein